MPLAQSSASCTARRKLGNSFDLHAHAHMHNTRPPTKHQHAHMLLINVELSLPAAGAAIAKQKIKPRTDLHRNTRLTESLCTHITNVCVQVYLYVCVCAHVWVLVL